MFCFSLIVFLATNLCSIICVIEMRFISLDALIYTASYLFLTYMQNCFFIIAFLFARFFSSAIIISLLRMSLISFFIFGFQLAFLCAIILWISSFELRLETNSYFIRRLGTHTIYPYSPLPAVLL